MKTLALIAAFSLAAVAPALAGNVEPFEPPVVVVDDPEEPIGSNAAWLIPLLAVVAIGVGIAVSED
ncbi:MAG: hypothetical protein AAGA32_20700 [Pseudomonadota bacterium]